MNSADLTPRTPNNGNAFGDFFTPQTSFVKSDVYEQDNSFIVEMDIPGFLKEEINIDYQNGFLIVGATKKEAKEVEGRSYIRRERYFNQINRQFYLGNTDPGNVKAEYKEGILRVVVPKAEGASNKSRIPLE